MSRSDDLIQVSFPAVISFSLFNLTMIQLNSAAVFEVWHSNLQELINGSNLARSMKSDLETDLLGWDIYFHS